jgi:hypothetical protein
MALGVLALVVGVTLWGCTARVPALARPDPCLPWDEDVLKCLVVEHQRGNM